MRLVHLLIFGLFTLQGCSRVFFYPSKEYPGDPSDLRIQFEDSTIRTSDGESLRGWVMKSNGPAVGSIIFLHGNGANMANHLASIYWLPDYGYNVLTFDYRGYGGSSGTPSIHGALLDVEAVFTYALSHPQLRDTPLYVFGQSLGGSLAIKAVAATPHKHSFKALAVESAFSSYRQIARDTLARLWFTWIFQWPLSFTVSNSTSPMFYIKDISPLPLLIIHGSEDPIVPAYHAHDLFNAAAQPKELWEISHGQHIDNLTTQSLRIKFVDWLGACH